MTIEQLLELPPGFPESLTDDQLLQHFNQYLDVTRPDRVRKKQTQPKITEYISPGKRNALQALEDMGVDLSLFKNRKRKK